MKRWKAPNDPTPQAKQVWSALFPHEPWPRGWRVEWVGFMRGASGLTMYRSRKILLSYGDARRFAKEYGPAAEGPLDVLLHEFVHMRVGPSLRHGKEFRRLVRGLHERLS